jgi:hypothetical protein
VFIFSNGIGVGIGILSGDDFIAVIFRDSSIAQKQACRLGWAETD